MHSFFLFFSFLHIMIVIYKRIERQSFLTPKEGAKYAYFLAKLCQMQGLGSLRFFIKPIPSVYFNVGEIDFFTILFGSVGGVFQIE